MGERSSFVTLAQQLPIASRLDVPCRQIIPAQIIVLERSSTAGIEAHGVLRIARDTIAPRQHIPVAHHRHPAEGVRRNLILPKRPTPHPPAHTAHPPTILAHAPPHSTT